ncbi:MAG: hypothetical protein DMG06_22940 [Acidobacteria bacterium]|nr:MAG: hypothetical protein DMG06_22940 [Acidobacteriota bacterium]
MLDQSSGCNLTVLKFNYKFETGVRYLNSGKTDEFNRQVIDFISLVQQTPDTPCQSQQTG